MSDQFAVYRSPGKARVTPYVVVVQSNRFRRSDRCVVVPLVLADSFGVSGSDSDLGPRFVIEGQEVVFDPLQITNVPRNRLGETLGTLSSEEDRITNALDVMLSKAWR